MTCVFVCRFLVGMSFRDLHLVSPPGYVTGPALAPGPPPVTAARRGVCA